MKAQLIFLTTILILSCDNKNEGQFNFRYNEADIDEINTFSTTFSRKYIRGKESWIFQLTDNEIKKINDFAKEIGIQDIETIVDKDTCGNDELRVSFPTIEHEFEFEIGSGQRKIIKWGNNDCEDPVIQKVQSFVDSLKVIILTKEELRTIRETDILIL